MHNPETPIMAEMVLHDVIPKKSSDEIFHTVTGIYKTGRWQSTNGRWYGKVGTDGQMHFIKKESFDQAIKSLIDPNIVALPPQLDKLPF